MVYWSWQAICSLVGSVQFVFYWWVWTSSLPFLFYCTCILGGVFDFKNFVNVVSYLRNVFRIIRPVHVCVAPPPTHTHTHARTQNTSNISSRKINFVSRYSIRRSRENCLAHTFKKICHTVLYIIGVTGKIGCELQNSVRCEDLSFTVLQKPVWEIMYLYMELNWWEESYTFYICFWNCRHDIYEWMNEWIYIYIYI